MAHIPKPRRTASFSMPPVPRATKGMVKKGVVPKMGKPASGSKPKPARLSIGSLSILKYEPDWKDVYENMFEKEANIDRYTNEFSGDK